MHLAHQVLLAVWEHFHPETVEKQMSPDFIYLFFLQTCLVTFYLQGALTGLKQIKQKCHVNFCFIMAQIHIRCVMLSTALILCFFIPSQRYKEPYQLFRLSLLFIRDRK